jgi:hypothetical protein
MLRRQISLSLLFAVPACGGRIATDPVGLGAGGAAQGGLDWTACCECDAEYWVAASFNANLEQVFCAPANGCAADCASGEAICLSAFCNLNDHCELSYVCLN